MMPRFELFRDRRKEWRFRLIARNGKIIAASEAYVSKRNAILGIESIKDCAIDAKIFEID